MDQQDRKASIRARMDELIKAIAKAICDGNLPVTEQRVLRVRLAREQRNCPEG